MTHVPAHRLAATLALVAASALLAPTGGLAQDATPIAAPGSPVPCASPVPDVAASPGPSDAPGEGVPASPDAVVASADPGASAPPCPSSAPAAVGTVAVRAFDLGFDPKAITVPAGASTRLVLVDSGRLVHNITIDGLGVQVVSAPGASNETTIVDPPPGTYAFYCSISGHRQAGMEGILTVR